MSDLYAGVFKNPFAPGRPKPMVHIKINAADPQGGVWYVRTKGKPPEMLRHGQTYEVDEIFAQELIHSKRAVLAQGDVIESRPLTTDALSADPVVQTQGEPARRKR